MDRSKLYDSRIAKACPRMLWLACACLLGLGCTFKLELKDDKAPSLQGVLEMDYELKRWGGEEQGRVPTPPALKASGNSVEGVGFRFRGRFSNTFTWTEPEGFASTEILWPDDTIYDEDELKADGWSYRGKLHIMPGFSFWHDQIFVAGVVGIEGTYLDLPIVDEATGEETELGGEMGYFGIPVGWHVEWMIGNVGGPRFSSICTFNVSTSGPLPNNSILTNQLGGVLWPGSIFPALGPYLWIEAGYRWSSYSADVITGIINVDTSLYINGPYAAVGLRF